MKKHLGKALAMAVMMSVFCGSAYAEDKVIISAPLEGYRLDYGYSPSVRLYRADYEASLWPDSLQFGYKEKIYASYHKNGMAITGNPDHKIFLNNGDGLDMGNLQITNVTDITATGTIKAGTSGEIKSGETGLVNGGAVYTALQGYVEKGTVDSTTSDAIGKMTSVGTGAYYSSAIGYNASVHAGAYYSVAVGPAAEIFENAQGSTAVGECARVYAQAGTAVGHNAWVMEGSIYSTAIGNDTTISEDSLYSDAFGSHTLVKNNASYAVALGAQSIATEKNTVSVGNDTLKRKITNVAAGDISSATSTDAVTGGQIYTMTNVAKGNYIAAGTNVAGNLTALDTQVKINADDIASLKTSKADKTYVDTELAKKANAADVYTKSETESAISTAVNTATAGKADKSYVDTELGKKANAADVYTKSDVDTKLGAKADKTYVDTELGKKANAADVYTKTETDAAIAAATYDDTAIKADIAKKADKADLNAEETARINADKDLQSQIDAIGSGSSAGMAELNNKISATNDRVDRVGATAAALAGIHYQPMAKGQSQVAVGMGGYKGKKATALGLAYQFNDRVSGSVAGAANGSEHMFNVGFNYLFGQHSAKDIAQCAAVPGSMSLKEAEMQATIDSQNAKINSMESRMAQLEAMVKALAAK